MLTTGRIPKPNTARTALSKPFHREQRDIGRVRKAEPQVDENKRKEVLVKNFSSSASFKRCLMLLHEFISFQVVFIPNTSWLFLHKRIWTPSRQTL